MYDFYKYTPRQIENHPERETETEAGKRDDDDDEEQEGTTSNQHPKIN